MRGVGWFRWAGLPPLPVPARGLLNELDQLECSLVLVLDDYHCIPNRAVLDLLNELLVHPPRRMHVVLPTLELARLRARSQMTENRTHEPRFTETEAAVLLERVEGWVVLEGHTQI